MLCSLEMQLPIIFTNVVWRGEDIGITKYSSSLENVKIITFYSAAELCALDLCA